MALLEQVLVEDHILILQADPEAQLLLLILIVQRVQPRAVVEVVPMEIQEAYLEVLVEAELEVNLLWPLDVEQLVKEMQEELEKIVLLL